MKVLSVLALILVVVLLSGCGALPETGAVLDGTGGLILPSLDAYLSGVIQPLIAAIILVLLNFLLGVLAAVINGTFEWKRIADFLGSYFLLNILGWLIAEFLVLFIPAVFPELPEWIDSAMVLTLRGAVFSSLLGAILQKGQNLGLWKTEFGGLLTRLGVPPELSVVDMAFLEPEKPVEPE